jgi:hypothetical protein
MDSLSATPCAGSTPALSHQKKSFISTCGEKIHEKVDAILTRLAFGNQWNQLDIISKKNPEIAALKRDSLNEHIKTVSTWDKFTLALKLLAEKINFIRTILMRKIIHPATFQSTYEKTSSTYTYYNDPQFPWINKQPVLNGESFDFYSKDHQQLNGMVIYADLLTRDKNKPVVIMCLGNEQVYEDLMDEASLIAKEKNVNVVLYNARGVGLSLGEELTTDEAVEDCKAAIKYALNNFCDNDPNRLQVFGHSLGGGITVAALDELINEKIFEKIGAYYNHRSFSSMPDLVEGIRGISAKIGRGVFNWLGLNPLDSAKVLSTKKVARKVYVITAKNDQVMKANGRLANYLQQGFPHHNDTKKNIKQDLQNKKEDIDGEVVLTLDNKPNIKIEYYEQADAGHNSDFDMDYIQQKIQESIPPTAGDLEALAL